MPSKKGTAGLVAFTIPFEDLHELGETPRVVAEWNINEFINTFVAEKKTWVFRGKASNEIYLKNEKNDERMDL